MALLLLLAPHGANEALNLPLLLQQRQPVVLLRQAHKQRRRKQGNVRCCRHPSGMEMEVENGDGAHTNNLWQNAQDRSRSRHPLCSSYLIRAKRLKLQKSLESRSAVLARVLRLYKIVSFCAEN